MKAAALLLAALAVLALGFEADEGRVSYAGHKVLRLELQPSQLDLARGLEDVIGRHERVDWWREPAAFSSEPTTSDIRVSPAMMPKVEKYLARHGIAWSVMIADIEESATMQLTAVGNSNLADGWFNQYHDYNSTVTWIQQLVSQYSSLAKLVTVGTTYQGRTIYAVQVASKPYSGQPQIVYDGGIHAREWISPATVQFILFNLLSNYGKDAQITKMVDNIQWTIIPIFNADGYQFTCSGDRMWRKTRMPNKGSSCIGTDPCRNSATGWGGGGSSSDPCAEDYRGVKAFDQPEVAAVSSFIQKLPNVKGYTNFHSYSQLYMTPWGYTYKLPPTADYQKQMAFANQAVAAIKAVHGVSYTAGPIAPTIYQASGVISDWVYDQCKVLYSISCELRDTGQYGFLLPPQQIIPTGEEIMAAVKVMANTILTSQ